MLSSMINVIESCISKIHLFFLLQFMHYFIFHFCRYNILPFLYEFCSHVLETCYLNRFMSLPLCSVFYLNKIHAISLMSWKFLRWHQWWILNRIGQLESVILGFIPCLGNKLVSHLYFGQNSKLFYRQNTEYSPSYRIMSLCKCIAQFNIE